jgi:hypothetical protein
MPKKCKNSIASVFGKKNGAFKAHSRMTACGGIKSDPNDRFNSESMTALAGETTTTERPTLHQGRL